jgi:hypothetical protein
VQAVRPKIKMAVRKISVIFILMKFAAKIQKNRTPIIPCPEDFGKDKQDMTKLIYICSVNIQPC